jgi:hypothetical protein
MNGATFYYFIGGLPPDGKSFRNVRTAGCADSKVIGELRRKWQGRNTVLKGLRDTPAGIFQL